MANNDDMMATMNGDQTPLSNNIFLRWLSKKLNPNSASAADTSDLDNPMVGAGSDGGNAGYGEGSHERGNEGADENGVTSATTVPSMFAFAAKPAPAAGSSPDLAATNPRQPKPSIGQLQRGGQNPPQFRPSAVGLINNPDNRTQAEVGEDAENLPQNNFGVPYGGEGELGVLSGVGENTVPNEIAAETNPELPSLAEQGSKYPLLRGLQKLLGLVGNQPAPGEKYDPASAESHKIARGVLERLGNAGAAIGFDTDPRLLALKKQEMALELGRLNEDINYRNDILNLRGAHEQEYAQHITDLEQKLQQATKGKFDRLMVQPGDDGTPHNFGLNTTTGEKIDLGPSAAQVGKPVPFYGPDKNFMGIYDPESNKVYSDPNSPDVPDQIKAMMLSMSKSGATAAAQQAARAAHAGKGSSKPGKISIQWGKDGQAIGITDSSGKFWTGDEPDFPQVLAGPLYAAKLHPKQAAGGKSKGKIVF